MNTASPPPRENDFVSKTVEAAIRIGVLFFVAYWCFQILQPFVFPMVWGVVLAIAMYPLYRRLNNALGGDHRRVAAALLTLLMLVVLILPAAILTETVISGAQNIAEGMQAGTMNVPPPPESIKDWPLIGSRVYDFWRLLSENLESAVAPLLPQLQVFAKWLLAGAADAGIGILIFLVAIIISGVLLAYSAAGTHMAQAIGRRLAGERGQEFVDVAGATIRSVATGILGVAIIQALLAGIGFLAVGLPGAGLWALLVLFLCIIQIGPALVILPIIIYVFYTTDLVIAIIFTIWIVLVGLLDNVLKPLLLGRGVPVPTLIIFLGAIGGFLSAGIVGLFVGAVVLALGYRLFLLWLHQEDAAPAEAGKQNPPTV